MRSIPVKDGDIEVNDIFLDFFFLALWHMLTERMGSGSVHIGNANPCTQHESNDSACYHTYE